MAQSNQSLFQFDPGASPHHDLKIWLRPSLFIEQNVGPLSDKQVGIYVSFLRENHDKICQKIGRLLDIQITKFIDPLSCKGRIKDLAKLESVWNLWKQEHDQIDEDIKKFIQEWKFHEKLGVSHEMLRFSLAIDEKSYKIGLLALQPEEEANIDAFASAFPVKQFALTDENEGSSVDQAVSESANYHAKGANNMPSRDDEKVKTTDGMDESSVNKSEREKHLERAESTPLVAEGALKHAEHEEPSDKAVIDSDTESESLSEQNLSEPNPSEEDSKTEESGKGSKGKRKKRKKRKKKKRKESSKKAEVKKMVDKPPENYEVCSDERQGRGDVQASFEKPPHRPEESSKKAEVKKMVEKPPENYEVCSDERQGRGDVQASVEKPPHRPKESHREGAVKRSDHQQPHQEQELTIAIYLVTPRRLHAVEAWITVTSPHTREASKGKTYLKQSPTNETVWKATVRLPLKDAVTSTYVFGVLKHGYIKNSPLWEQEKRPLPLKNSLYHVFDDFTVRQTSKEWNEAYEGCGTIVELVCKKTVMNTFKEDIMDLYDQQVVACLMQTYNWEREKSSSVFRKLLDLLQEGNESQIICLLHVLANCREINYSLKLDVPDYVAQKSLEIVRRSHHTIFPSNTNFSALGKLCQDFYDKAFHKHMTAFSIVYYCYPCLTAESVLAMLKFERGNNEDGLDKCLGKLVSLFEKDGREVMQVFLSVAQRVRSFEKLLEVMKTMSQSSMIQAELFEEMQSRVENEIVAKVNMEIGHMPVYQTESLRKTAAIIQKLVCHAREEVLHKVQLTLELKIIQIIRGNSLSWKEDEIQVLLQIISSDFTFSEENHRQLMSFLAESTDEKLHTLFIMYLENTHAPFEAKYHQTCVDWLNQGKAFVKRSRELPFNKVLNLYTFLGRILALKYVVRVADLTADLEECIFTEVCNFRVEVLMKASENIKSLPEKSQQVFDKHCKARLLIHHQKFNWEKDSESILDDVFGRENISLNRRETYFVMFMEEMLAKHPAYTIDYEDTGGIKTIFQNWKFWTRIMTCRGSAAESITSHKTTNHVKKLLNQLWRNLQTLHLSPKYAVFVVQLLKNTAHENCASLFGKAVIAFREHEFKQSEKKLQESVKELNRRFKSLEAMNQLLQFIDKTKCKIAGLTEREKECKMFIEDVSASHYSIIDVLGNPDWENLWRLSACLEMHDVSTMSSFKNHIVGDFESLALGEDGEVSKPDVTGDTKPEDVVILENDDGDGKVTIDLIDEQSEEAVVIEDMEARKVIDYVHQKLLQSYKVKARKLLLNEESVLVCQVENFFKGCNILEEVKLIEAIYAVRTPKSFMSTLNYIAEFQQNTDEAEYLSKLPAVFVLHSDDTKGLSLAVSNMLEMKENNFSLETDRLCKQTKTFKQLTKSVTEHQWEIIAELSRSQGLVEFLISVKDEDLRNLIDAVEEHSDELLQEGTVSDLIQLKNMLRPVLQQCSENKSLTLSKLIEILNSSFSTDASQAPQRISNCAHNCNSLKALYMNVANRGEVTKQTVERIIKEGIYVFTLKSDVVLSVVKCNERVYPLSELSDLRSRALLIGNTEKQDETEEDSKTGNLVYFVELVDLVNDVQLALQQLSKAGHFDFESVHYLIQEETFEDKLTQLDKWKGALYRTLQEWEEALEHQRSQHYYLNYLHGKQLPIVFKFFETRGSSGKNAVGILRYMKQSAQEIDLTVIELFVEGSKSDVSIKLDYLGRQLEATIGMLPEEKQIPIRKNKAPDFTNIDSRVEQGNIYVAHIDFKTSHVLPVVLSLYANTTGFFPLPAQVLFCNDQTTLEECHILLNRSLFGINKGNHLYCMVGVELLEYDVLFSLMSKLKTIQSKSESDPNEKPEFLFALICRSEVHHPLLDSFRDKVHRIPGLTTPELEQCLQRACPSVHMVTSDLPGLGKTEKIHNIAAEANKGIVTVPISGLQSKMSLLNLLQKARVCKDVVLHLDIGCLDHCQVLDHLIFEVVVMKFAIFETSYFELETCNVAIEICNTLNNYLQNDLYVTSCFTPINVKWHNFEDFVVSVEPSSAVQVVCQYLRLQEEDGFGREDIKISDKSTPMETTKCRTLLRKMFDDDKNMSFSVVNTFLEVLANQLRKLSVSQYFRITYLVGMLGDQNMAYSVRKVIVTQLILMSKEFSCRSIRTCKAAQNKSLSLIKGSGNSEVAEMVSRVEGMIQWNSSNHLLLLFHLQDNATVSALYRKVSDVPDHIKQLFEKQLKRPLPDLAKQSQDDLQNRLERLVCDKRDSDVKDRLGHLCETYAVTPDNLLKMVLIVLRIKNGVPVVLMGETGCGKTTLVKYLAKTCNANCDVFQFHAGVTEELIKTKVFACNRIAERNLDLQQWLFLDEINTCNHIGLLNEIIINHSCGGYKLSPNLVTLAACNPYRLRTEHEMLSCGLREKIRTDKFSQLVYRVHPLPETMIDFAWDYGTLHEKDEHLYIKRMVLEFEKKLPNLADILMDSQKFIRKAEINMSAVSLRDVYRCKKLISWFVDFLKEKEKHFNCHKNQTLPLKFSTMHLEKRAMILALSLAYEVRMPDTSMRRDYWTKIAETPYEKSRIIDYIRWEQMNILNRMVLPHGTAKNTALRENVFVILTCMLNRIPIFLVGKPGCSKSLSVQVLKSSLRGPDAVDKFLQTLPELYIVSYQGSESSTSEGIQKVFEKASNYKKHKRSENILPVVLLDEVGLAEISKFNPLKVLHSLLEPETGEFPDVAVIGISNWALDPAKMNRAVHLSRPDLTADELVDTGKAIRDGFENSAVPDDILKAMAMTYFKYHKTQPMKHFHGLRDFYSLVKFLCSRYASSTTVLNINQETKVILRGIQRNFGGLSNDPEAFAKSFAKYLSRMSSEHLHGADVEQLIADNLDDKGSRHLMLITSGDSSLGLISEMLKESGKQYEIIFGSKFEEDMNEEYNYRIISKIILCMEQGVVLILKDLEGIYGSLYDMLNQNYTIVGRRKNCRIALDAYSNPMCVVHDNFKCIVIVDRCKVDYSDPPFLNRFEKQIIQYEEVLSASQLIIVKTLEEWVADVSYIEGKTFGLDDTFLGYQSESIPSLIHSIQKQGDEEELVIQKCKESLLHTCPPSAVLRMSLSELAQKDPVDIETMQNRYFDGHINEGLKHFFDAEGLMSSTVAKKYVIMTNSDINTDVQALCTGIPCHVEKLSALKSEKQLSKQISRFFSDDDNVLFVLQCKPVLDSAHMLLVKLLIENQRQNYLQSREPGQLVKHVAFIVHLSRQEDKACDGWKFDYTNEWEIFTLDRIEETNFPIEKALLGKSPCDLLQSDFCPIKLVLEQNLIWALGKLKYPKFGGSAKRLWDVADQMRHSEPFLDFVSKKVLEQIHKMSGHTRTDVYHPDNWYVDVASSPIKMFQGCSLHGALNFHLQDLVKTYLVLLVWFVEDTSSWQSYTDLGHKDITWLQLRWEELFEKKFFQYDSLKGDSLESTRRVVTHSPLTYLLPYSRDLLKDIGDVIQLFHTRENIGHIDSLEDILPEDRGNLLRRYRTLIEQRIIDHLGQMECDKDSFDRIVNDFCLEVCHTVIMNNEDDYYDKSSSEICQLFLQGSCLSMLGGESIDEVVVMVLTWAIQQQKVIQLLHLLTGCGSLVRTDVIAALKTYINQPEEDDDGERTDIDEYLVASICKRLLPVKKHTREFPNADMWYYKCSQFLAYASKVSQLAELLHFLRLCRDIFASSLFDNKEDCVSFLETVCQKALSEDTVTGFRGVIDCDNVFQEVQKATECAEPSDMRMQKILCMYFIRCLDANPDTCRKSDIIQFITNQEISDNLMAYAVSILQRILLESVSKETLLAILKSDQEIESIAELQSFLQCTPVTKFHSLICLCTDIVENMMIENLQPVIEFSEHFIQMYEHAVSLIKRSENWSMRYIVCVSYVRLFSCKIAEMTIDYPETMDKERACIQRFDASLLWKTADDENLITMKVYFLKQLYRGSLKDLQERVQTLPSVGLNLKDLTWPTDQLECGIGFNGMTSEDIPDFDSDDISCVIAKLLPDLTNIEHVVGILAERYYWPRYIKPLDHSERLAINEIKLDIPGHLKVLVECVLGRETFADPCLNISQESTYQSLLQASFLLHLFTVCVVTSEKLLHQLVNNPETAPTFVGNLEELSLANLKTEVQMMSCKCNYVVFMDTNQETQCDHCKENITVTKYRCNKGQIFKCQTPALCFGRMLVNGCTLVKANLQKDFSNEEVDESYRSFKSNWNSLLVALNISERQMAGFLHMVLKNADMRNVEDAFQFLHCCNALVEQKETVMTEFTQGFWKKPDAPPSLFSILNECDHSTDNGYNIICRQRSVPNVEKLCHQIACSSFEMCPFLHIMLMYKEELSLLRHLLPIVRWHLMLYRCVNVKMTDKDTDKLLIYEFMSEYTDAKDCFDQFKKCWDIVKRSKTVKNRVCETAESAIPEISKRSPVSSCVVQNQNSPLYKVISVLCDIQNSFLKKVALTGLAGSKGLSFLKKGPFVEIPTIHLETAQDSNIIQFAQFEGVVNYCHNIPRYGHGLWEKYHFDQIEKDMADALLLGKHYLILDKDFPFTMYRNQVFHQGGHSLTVLRNDTKQEGLTDNMKVRLSEGLTEKNGPVSLQPFLTFLETVMIFIKKTGIQESELLGSYGHKWGIEYENVTSVTLREQIQKYLHLCHTCSLYEFLEEEAARTVYVESLDETYNVKPSPEVIQISDEYLDRESKYHLNLLSAVRRLIVRHISSQIASMVSPDLTMEAHLFHPDLWSSYESKNSPTIVDHLKETFPTDLLMENIKWFHDGLNSKIMVKEERWDMTAAPIRTVPKKKKRTRILISKT